MKQKNLTIDGKKVSYFDSETVGIPLVLLSGWTHQFHEEKDFIRHLSKSNRVIAISWPGYGDSDSDTRAMNMSYLARIVHELLESLDLKEFVLVGFSMGTQIAAHFAYNYQKNVKMVLISAPLRSFASEAPWFGRVILRSQFILQLVRKIPIFRDNLVKMAYSSIARVTENSRKQHKWKNKKVTLMGAYDTLIALLTDFVDPLQCPQSSYLFGEHEVLQLDKNLENKNVLIVKGIGHGAFGDKPKELAIAVRELIDSFS